jgi:hypothetical protein
MRGEINGENIVSEAKLTQASRRLGKRKHWSAKWHSAEFGGRHPSTD